MLKINIFMAVICLALLSLAACSGHGGGASAAPGTANIAIFGDASSQNFTSGGFTTTPEITRGNVGCGSIDPRLVNGAQFVFAVSSRISRKLLYVSIYDSQATSFIKRESNKISGAYTPADHLCAVKGSETLACSSIGAMGQTRISYSEAPVKYSTSYVSHSSLSQEANQQVTNEIGTWRFDNGRTVQAIREIKISKARLFRSHRGYQDILRKQVIITSFEIPSLESTGCHSGKIYTYSALLDGSGHEISSSSRELTNFSSGR